MHDFPKHYILQDGIYFPASQSQPFEYSDGEEFEVTIKNIITSAKDRSLFSPELRNAYWDWRSSCHLSPVRANILRPLEEICRGRVLELGSGCGIISRYLGELGSDLVALEASPLRAQITKARTEDLNNVQVVCDRIEDFNSESKFDVVTMIGVLQYARLFSNCGEKAELTFIENAARQLRRNGVLVIAIQNKLSLKSLSGYPEPNVGVPYFGIENKYDSESIVRFGLDEIKGILSMAGLSHHAVLFPFPDYHMPVSILNESATRADSRFRAEPLISASANRDRARPDWTTPQFSLERAWEATQSSGATAYLANAFLIVAGKTEQSLSFHKEMNEYAWHYSVDRHPAFATQKRFCEKGNNIDISRSLVHTTSTLNIGLTHHLEDEKYLNGSLWWEEFVEIVNKPEWSTLDLASWVNNWLIALKQNLNLDEALPDTLVPGSAFDLTPFNCIRTTDGTLQFIDQEWEIHEELPYSFIIIRGLFGSFTGLSSYAKPSKNTPHTIIELIRKLMLHLDVSITDAHIEQFIMKEENIQNWINKGSQPPPCQNWAEYVHSTKISYRETNNELKTKLTEHNQKSNEAEVDKDHRLKIAEDKLKAYEERLENILHSSSWRLTKPLRKLKKILKQVTL